MTVDEWPGERPEPLISLALRWAGVLPPVWQLPGTERLIAFSRVDGQVNPIEGEAGFVGPAGDGGRFGTTDVRSYEGISGIAHR